jgi:MoaA/NifB/PqqE/SkfB family radical SAM enzyme
MACRHCVFSSSPKLRHELALSTTLDAMSELSRISTLRRIGVSGGEPFLDFPALCALAEHATNLGLTFRVVSNGSFATSDAVAERLLSVLKRYNLEAVCFSWDHFHQEFAPADRIRTALRACRRLGVSTKLTAVITESHRLSESIDALGDEAFGVSISQVKCLPVGRARKAVDAADLLSPAPWEIGRACRADFDTLALTHDGAVYPCCMVGGFTDGIKLGVYPDENMETLLRRRDTGLKWAILAAQGPQYFMKHMTAEERESICVSETSHDCVNCNRLFSSAIGDRIADRAVERLRAQAGSIFGL